MPDMPDPTIGPQPSAAQQSAIGPMPTPNPSPAQPPQPTAPPAMPAPAATPIPNAGPNAVLAKPGQTFHNLSHSLMGAVLGSLAGAPPSQYSTDPTGKMTGTPGPNTTGDKLRRIAQAALIGLAAGSKIDPQKSGLAQGLAGAGAGAEAEIGEKKKEDLLKRQQSTEEFKNKQEALLNQATNAHIAIETAALRQNLLNSTLETNQKMAAVGGDAINAMMETPGGQNRIEGQRDIPEDQMADFRKEHQGDAHYTNFTPLLTKVEPSDQTNPDGTPKVNRFYTFVDMKDPVPITQSMIDHLKAVHFDGADTLQAGMMVDPKQFQMTLANGLKMYNDAEREGGNKKLQPMPLPNGQMVQSLINTVTGSVQILRDTDGNPIPATEGKDLAFRELDTDPRTNRPWPDGKTHTVALLPTTGAFVKDVGVLGSAAQNTDISNQSGIGTPIVMKNGAPTPVYGEEFLQTVPQEYKNVVREIATYRLAPGPFEVQRKGTKGLAILEAAGDYNKDFDQKQYNKRSELLDSFGAKEDFHTDQSLNMALMHVNMLYDAANNLNNGNIQAANDLGLRLGQALGDPRVTDFTTARNAVATEVTSALKRGAGTDPELNKMAENLGAKSSPAQLTGPRGAITDIVRLLGARTKTQATAFKDGMGISDPGQIRSLYGVDILQPDAAKVLQKVLGPAESMEIMQEAGVGAPPNPQSTQGASTPPAAAPNTPKTPQSHIFDAAQWSKNNPGGDINAAAAEAVRQGYKVTNYNQSAVPAPGGIPTGPINLSVTP